MTSSKTTLVFNYVEEGQTIKVGTGPISDMEFVDEVVGAKHEGGQGPWYWYCAIHRKGFRMNIEMQKHNAEPGTHVWAWMCLEHGPEVP